jgi:CDGSH-type Zn-finger protein/uncharacterized Fe-S cluster protein YjdI
MPHRRTYETDAIRVHWDSSRCIHTGICLRTLPSVFDVERRPWVDLSDADVDAVAEAVARCPTGALRYERLDGADGERPERPTLVFAIEDGPLLMFGDLDVRTPSGERITREARLSLCRCGMTRNQPFCDNSHLRRGWESGPTNEPDISPPAPAADAGDGPTTVVPRDDGSLDLRGDLRLYHSDGRALAEAGRVLLCRCGNSRNKPFCDSSHERAGFRSREPELAPDRLDAETPAAFTANEDVPDPRVGVGATFPAGRKHGPPPPAGAGSQM